MLAVYAWAIGAGLLNGFLVGRLGLNPIIATLGTNALLFGAVLGISGGIPRTTTRLLSTIAGGRTVGIPNAVFFALGDPRPGHAAGQEDRRRTPLRGGRGQALPPRGPPACAYRTHRGAAYVWAQLLYCLAGILLAGITNQPTAFQGNSYLLPSVAVVVLGGTSLLGGRGFPAATVVAALFLSQLDQFVLALGVPFAVRTLVQAAALAIGVAIYTVNWAAVRRALRRPTEGCGTRDHLTEFPLTRSRGAPRETPCDAAVAPDYGGET